MAAKSQIPPSKFPLLLHARSAQLIAVVKAAWILDPKFRDQAMRVAKTIAQNAAGWGGVSRATAPVFAIGRGETAAAAAAIELAIVVVADDRRSRNG
ncbi:hypothetical protein LVJ94_53000 [Pendulispora rubella]|uniref:Uncharacterized protein n=1 Tax=Pendulispora rubella TaxID=2741070 RepID=A0ABZ2L3S2_9BACT